GSASWTCGRAKSPSGSTPAEYCDQDAIANHSQNSFTWTASGLWTILAGVPISVGTTEPRPEETRHVHRDESLQGPQGRGARLRGPLARSRDLSSRRARLRRIPSPQGTGTRRSCAVRVSFPVAVEGGVRGPAPLRGLPRGAPPRR